MNDIPRRICLDKLTPAETAIVAAVDAVEAMGADERLTHAVIKLGQARDHVADFVDGVVPPAAETQPAPVSEEPVTPRKRALVKQALYDAKFALEQELYGEEKEKTIRTMVHALDLIADVKDVQLISDEQLATLVGAVRKAPTQGAAERCAMELAGQIVDPLYSRAHQTQDIAHRRVRELEEKNLKLEEELRAEKQKVARLAMRKA